MHANFQGSSIKTEGLCRSVCVCVCVCVSQIRIPRAGFSFRSQLIINFSQDTILDLIWWTKPSGFLSNCTLNLRQPIPTLHIWSDASMSGCGAHDSLGNIFQRVWTQDKLSLQPQINLSELRAAKEALAEFAVPGQIIRMHLDNKTAVCYIAKHTIKIQTPSSQRRKEGKQEDEEVKEGILWKRR